MNSFTDFIVLDEKPDREIKSYQEYLDYLKEKKVNEINAFLERCGDSAEVFECNNDIVHPNTPEGWLEAFEQKNISVESGTREILEKIEHTVMLENQKFVKITVEQLFGDTSSLTYDEVCKKAVELGFELCAQDDGLKLRLSVNQNINDLYAIGSEPFQVNSYYIKLVLNRDDDGRAWLSWYDSNNWTPNSKFIFRIPNLNQ